MDETKKLLMILIGIVVVPIVVVLADMGYKSSVAKPEPLNHDFACGVKKEIVRNKEYIKAISDSRPNLTADMIAEYRVAYKTNPWYFGIEEKQLEEYYTIQCND